MVLRSTHGDPYYVGLNGMEIVEIGGRTVALNPDQIHATPFRCTFLPYPPHLPTSPPLLSLHLTLLLSSPSPHISPHPLFFCHLTSSSPRLSPHLSLPSHLCRSQRCQRSAGDKENRTRRALSGEPHRTHEQHFQRSVSASLITRV